ncbi:MAG: PilZ domain-containing protein, partial [bacterium]|nr:PilZ domain-containing protein [bacterium]
WGEGFIYFYSSDLSLGGLFLESEVPLKQGTKVFLSFTLQPGLVKIRTTGEVVRLEKEGGGSVLGMGVRFLDLTDPAREAIRAYIEEAGVGS